ncbi:MAG: cytochrome c [Alphaproteobacteria bacterium]|nr:cytochrome c [Alphaproteobacteria bacterium]
MILACASHAIAEETDVNDSSMAAIVAIGESIAEDQCGRCHALGTNDDSPHKSAPPFRIVAKRYKLEDLAESLVEGIMVGHPDMPTVALKEEEVDAFLTYLGSLLPER